MSKLNEYRIADRVKILEKNIRYESSGVVRQDDSKPYLYLLDLPICTIEERNKNDRVYSRELWEKVLVNEHVQDLLKRRVLFGKPDHPKETVATILGSSHIVTDIKINGDMVYTTMEVLNTPEGRIIATLLDSGCVLGVSTRADGELEKREQVDGDVQIYVNEDSYLFEGVDFVVDPSTWGAHVDKGRLEKNFERLAEDVESAYAPGVHDAATGLIPLYEMVSRYVGAKKRAIFERVAPEVGSVDKNAMKYFDIAMKENTQLREDRAIVEEEKEELAAKVIKLTEEISSKARIIAKYKSEYTSLKEQYLRLRGEKQSLQESIKRTKSIEEKKVEEIGAYVRSKLNGLGLSVGRYGKFFENVHTKEEVDTLVASVERIINESKKVEPEKKQERKGIYEKSLPGRHFVDGEMERMTERVLESTPTLSEKGLRNREEDSFEQSMKTIMRGLRRKHE